jgi:hypothetical protein
MDRHHSVATLQKFLFPGRQGRRAHMTTTPLRAIQLVDSRTVIAHRVTDEAFAAGRGNGGLYQALCGLLVLPASLTAPARGHCPPCERGNTPTPKNGGTRGG